MRSLSGIIVPLMIIGLTGTNGSGKGTVCEILCNSQHKFQYTSLSGPSLFFSFHLLMSDIIREELTKVGKDHSRENMLQMGTVAPFSFFKS